MTVGFIGLGRMGLPMARSLRRAGFPLIVHNRTRARIALLADDDAGVTMAESPAEVVAGSEISITMLADGDAVEAVMSGADGALAGVRPGFVMVEMSTIGPVRARDLAARVAESGGELLDAPVSGSVALAEAGTLTTLVGGEPDAFATAQPVLAAMTATQLHLGPSGAGAAMKLGLNGIIAAVNHAVSEALVIAERSGIDRARAYDAILESAVGSKFVAYKRDAFVDPSEEPVAFTLALMQKDLALLLELGERLGVPLASAAAIHDALGGARLAAGDDADLAAVAGALRAASAIPEAGR